MAARPHGHQTPDTMSLFPERADPPSLADSSGARYLGTIPLEQRRLTGQVYTPLPLVEFILTQAEYTPERPLEKLSLLDPACGSGAFLLVAACRIASALSARGIDPRSKRGRRLLPRAVEKRVTGIDVDPMACALARTNVRSLVGELCGTSLPAGYFHDNVVEADYLLANGLAIEPADFIVGNPPYVSAVRITQGYKAQLRSTFATARGRLDFYTLFIERSLPYLAPDGTLAFITPDKFLTSVSARPLRELMAREGALRRLVSFRSHRVFADAATVPCIFAFRRGASPGPVELLECDDHGAEGGVSVHRRSTVPPSQFEDVASWRPVPAELLAVVKKIESTHPTLAHYTERLSAGFATGLDSSFVLSRSRGVDVEPELLRRAVRGRDVHAFAITDPGIDILVPYTYAEDGTPRLIDIDAYPRARRYLTRVKKDLGERHCVRVWEKAWFDLHDPVPFDLAARPKILVPDLASTNRFAFDPGSFCPLHSAYYIVPREIDPWYLTAVLNSKPIEFLVRLNAPIAKDGFSRYRKQFLLPLPVPELAAPEMRAISRAVQGRDYELAERTVNRAFGLTDQDHSVIHGFLGRVDLRRRASRATSL